MTISYTKKISSANLTNTTSLSCNTQRFRSLCWWNVKIDNIELVDSSLLTTEVDDSTSFLRLTHNYITSDENSITGPLRKGWKVRIYRVDASDPSIGENIISNDYEVVESTGSYTIIKYPLGGTDGNIPLSLGYMEYRPYTMVSDFSLECTPSDGSDGTTVLVDFETLEIPWTPQTEYTIEISPGFVKDKYAQYYDNPSFTTSFVTNEPAIVTGFTHTNKRLTIEYIRNVKPIVGTYYLHKSNGELAITFNPGEGVVSGKTITFSTNRLLEPDHTYYLLSDLSPVRDKDNIYAVQLNDPGIVEYQTGPRPSIINKRPYFGELNYNSPIIEMRFDRPMEINSGVIKLEEWYGHLDDQYIDITDNSRVRICGNDTIVINLRGLLVDGHRYYITMPADTVRDDDAFGFIGITTDNVFDFTVGNDLILSDSANDPQFFIGQPLVTKSGIRINNTPTSWSNIYTLNVYPSKINAIESITHPGIPGFFQSEIISNPDPDRDDLFGTILSITDDDSIIVESSSMDNESVPPYYGGSIKIYKKIDGAYDKIQEIDWDKEYGYIMSGYVSGDGSVLAYLQNNSTGEQLPTDNVGIVIRKIDPASGEFILPSFIEVDRYQVGNSLVNVNIEKFNYDGSLLLCSRNVYTVGIVPIVNIYSINPNGNSLFFSVAPFTTNSGNEWIRTDFSKDGSILAIASSSDQYADELFIKIYRKTTNGYDLIQTINFVVNSADSFRHIIVSPSGDKIYASKNFTTLVYSLSELGVWELTETLNYSIKQIDAEDSVRLVQDVYSNNAIYVKNLLGQWFRGNNTTINVEGFDPKRHVLSKSGKTMVIGDFNYNSNYGAFAVTTLEFTNSSFNNSTKTLQIVGWKDQINSIIDDISVTTAGYECDFELYYKLITPDLEEDYKTQVFKNTGIYYNVFSLESAIESQVIVTATSDKISRIYKNLNASFNLGCIATINPSASFHVSAATMNVTAKKWSAITSNVQVVSSLSAIAKNDLKMRLTTTSVNKDVAIYVSHSGASSDPIIVDWGDGTTTTVNSGQTNIAVTRTYASAAAWTIRVRNSENIFEWSHTSPASGLRAKITQIYDWPETTSAVLDPNFKFNGETSLTAVPDYLPKSFKNLSNMFYGCTSLNSINITNWDTSRITNMQYMFFNCSTFNRNLSHWDVHLIPTKPSNFDSGTTAWTNQAYRPVWGTYGN